MRVLAEIVTVLAGGWTLLGLGLKWRQRRKRAVHDHIDDLIRENERLDELLKKREV